MHGADEVLHRRLVGQADEVADVVHDQPGEVLRVVEVLTLQTHTHTNKERHTDEGRDRKLYTRGLHA